MRGSWDLGGSCIAASTACGRTTALPSENPCAEFPLKFLSTHQSARLHGTISTIFFQPFAFTGLYPIILFRTGTRAEADHLDRFSVRVIARERHFRCRASAYSSIFWNAITHELRASLLAGLPPAPRAAERPLCPQGTHVRNFRSVLEHVSIRSPSRDYIYHIFPTGIHVQTLRSA